MKYTLLFILSIFWFAANAQLEDITITSDSTYVAKPDTAFWQFYEIDGQYTRPNGTKKNVTLYRADLVIRQAGKRTIGVTSGVLFKKEYMEFLRQYRDQHNNEINIIVDALNGVRDRRDALVSEIKKTSGR